MRNQFIKTLHALAEHEKKLVLLTGDLGFKVFDDFRERFPEQFLNVGVAESLMVSVAAGLALEGYRPFVYSIASFLTMRPYEHIRNDICFHRADVIMVAIGGGFSYGTNGSSHHALNDVAIMRSLPEMRVFTPADPSETAWAVQEAFVQKGPSYIRLGRSGEPIVHKAPLHPGRVEKGIVVCEGDEIAILVSGFILPNVLWAAKELIKEGHSVRVISFPLIKPLKEELIVDCLERFSSVFTVEEHYLTGGFSAAVMELAVAKGAASEKICPITAMHVTIHQNGDHQYLQDKAGLSPLKILQRMKNFIKEKAVC